MQLTIEHIQLLLSDYLNGYQKEIRFKNESDDFYTFTSLTDSLYPDEVDSEPLEIRVAKNQKREHVIVAEELRIYADALDWKEFLEIDMPDKPLFVPLIQQVHQIKVSNEAFKKVWFRCSYFIVPVSNKYKKGDFLVLERDRSDLEFGEEQTEGLYEITDIETEDYPGHMILGLESNTLAIRDFLKLNEADKKAALSIMSLIQNENDHFKQEKLWEILDVFIDSDAFIDFEREVYWFNVYKEEHNL